MLCPVSANAFLLAGVTPGDGPAVCFVQEYLVLVCLTSHMGLRVSIDVFDSVFAEMVAALVGLEVDR